MSATNRGTPDVPLDVIEAVNRFVSPVQAWREHLDIEPARAAARMHMPLDEYLAMERGPRPDEMQLRTIAASLGLTYAQLASLYTDDADIGCL